MAGFSTRGQAQLDEMRARLARAASTVAGDPADDRQRIGALRAMLSQVAAPAGTRTAHDFDAMATLAAVAVLMLAEREEGGRR